MSKPSLRELCTQWRKVMMDGDTGPGKIARQVRSVVGEWEKYQDEADGATAKEWLKNVLPHPPHWWEDKAAAVESMGGNDAANHLHHMVITRLHHMRVSDSVKTKIKRAIMAETKARGGVIITLGGVETIIRHLAEAGEIPSLKREERRCAGCVAKDEVIARLNEQIADGRHERGVARH